MLDALLGGVLLADEPEPIAVAAAERVADCLLRLTVTEGKYHQVKRMIAAAGNRVDALHREAVAALSIDTELKPGEWRWMTAVDREKLGISA